MKKRILVLVLAVIMVMPFARIAAQAGTIVDVAAGNADFSTLVSLVQAAGLVDTLNGEGPFTVFAPTNEAFAKLPAFVVDYLSANPEALTQVLTYHVVAGKVASTDVTAEAADVATVQGGTVQAVSDGTTVKVNDASVVTADIEASNGVIHVIDTVLLPAFALPEVVPATVTGDIVADGSSTVEPLANAIATRFTEEGFGSSISIGESGTGGGFKAFCEEMTTDIANASRAIKSSDDAAKPEELQKCQANNRQPVAFRVGTDGLAIVVSAENSFLTDVSADQIKLIFGTAVKWSDVDPSWPAEDIIRYIPGTDSGTFDYFVERTWAAGETGEILAASNLNMSESDNVLVQGVESSPYAVGFFGYAYYVANAASLKTLAVNGVVPNFESVEAATYRYARPLYIYTTAQIMQEKPQVAAFINFFLTTVQDEITNVGYFPASEYALNRSRLWWLASAGAQ
jgi:phosphate transport system substrate-binding protein